MFLIRLDFYLIYILGVWASAKGGAFEVLKAFLTFEFYNPPPAPPFTSLDWPFYLLNYYEMYRRCRKKENTEKGNALSRKPKRKNFYENESKIRKLKIV